MTSVHKGKSKQKNKLKGKAHNRKSGIVKLWQIGSMAPPVRTLIEADNHVYTFYQSLNLGTVFSTSASVVTSYGLAITAGTHITQFANYQALFDQYRIDEIECWLQPYPNGVTTGMAYTAIDYDNATAVSPTAIQQLQNVEQGDCQVGHYRRWKPHCALAAYGGAFTAFSNVASPWIDSVSSAVQHYGFLASADVTSQIVPFDMVVRIKFSVRNVI